MSAHLESAYWHRHAGLLDPETAASVLRTALARGGDHADLFVEDSTSTGLTLKAGSIRDIQSSVLRGAGVRVIAGQVVGYAHTCSLTPESLLEAARTASRVATAETRDRIVDLQPKRLHDLASIQQYPDRVPNLEKVAILRRADDAARAFDPRICEVIAGYKDHVQRVLFASSAGEYGEDERVRTSLYVQAVASQGSLRQRGMGRLGGLAGLEIFETRTPEDVARKAARQAVDLLAAGEAPSGQLPVVLTNGWGAVLLHEAIGHGIEADFNRKGTSKFTGKLGTRVASDSVTIVDTALVPSHWGSLNVDDEAHTTQESLLVEDGVLVDYMYDRYNARLMGRDGAGGNGRRQNYRFLPIPRMTNTYMKPGGATKEEVFAAVDRGFYAADFMGGQVDISNGQFVFSVSEGYLIEDGKITRPVRGATLIGDGADVLSKISMVADDFELSFGACGKDGQYVPVGLGQPHLLVSSMTVGGTRQ